MNQEDYQKLQRAWSVGRSKNVEEGARQRVQVAVRELKRDQLGTQNVLVLGPQHGFELLEFREQGFASILGVDVVPSFCDDCRDLGFECLQGSAEELSSIVSGKWNIYASHTLEHCYDLPAAVQQIESVCDQWCFVGVPIEPESANAGHCSPIRSRKYFQSLFPTQTWRWVYDSYRLSEKGPGRGSVESLLVKQ